MCLHFIETEMTPNIKLKIHWYIYDDKISKWYKFSTESNIAINQWALTQISETS